MKILFVTTGIEPFETGGAQTHAFHLSFEMIENGHEVWITRWKHKKDSNNTDEFIDKYGIHHITINKDYSADNEAHSNNLDNWSASILKKIEPDIIHLFKLSPLAYSVARVGKGYGIPIIMTALGFPFCASGSLLRRDGKVCDGSASVSRCLSCVTFGSKGADNLIMKKLGPACLFIAKKMIRLRAFSKRLDHLLTVPRTFSNWEELCKNLSMVIAPSEVVVRTFSINVMKAEKITKLTYGIPNEFIKQRQDKNIEGTLRVSYFGKISPYKGVHVLIKSAMKASEKGVSFNLLIYGNLDTSSNPYHKNIKTMVENYNWPENVTVTLCGKYQQNELPKLYKNTDVVVVPSLWPENATIVVLESLAFGTPIIASNVEGILEFIKNGVNGWLFDFGNADALTDLLIKCANEKEKIRCMGINCHAVIGFKEMSNKIEELYNKLIQQCPKSSMVQSNVCKI